MSKRTRPRNHLADAQGIIAGLQKSPPANVKSLAVDGESFTVAQLVSDLQGVESLNQAPVDLKAQWQAAKAAAKAQAKTNQTKLTRIRRMLVEAYGPDLTGLAACGIVVATPAPRTAEANAIAAARASETRKANGTGKKPPQPKATVTVTEADGRVIGQSGSVAEAPAQPRLATSDSASSGSG